MFSNRRTALAVVSRNLIPGSRDQSAGASPPLPAVADRAMSVDASLVIRGAVVALMLAAAAPSARADGDDDSNTVVVSTHGMNLASLQGQAELGRRIERAARRVCQDGEIAHLAERRAYEECHDGAIAGAQRQIRVLIAKAGAPGAPGAIEVAEARP